MAGKIRCTICSLPPDIQEQVNERLLGYPGDLLSKPPRPPVAKMSQKGVEAWAKETHGLTIGYKSAGAHLENHLRPGQKAALEKATREIIKKREKRALGAADRIEARAASSHIDKAYNGSASLNAAVERIVADTDELDEVMQEVKRTIFSVSKTVRLRADALAKRLEASNHRDPKAILLDSDGDSTMEDDGPTAAEAAFVMGGANAYATLQRARVATILGKPTAGLRERGAEGAAGLKALVAASKPPPIAGDLPDDEEDFRGIDEPVELDEPSDAPASDPRDNVVPLRPSRPAVPIPTSPAAPASGSTTNAPTPADASFLWGLEADK